MFLANFIKDRSQKHYENCDFIKDSNNLFLIFEKKINISILERQLDSSILNSADFILNLKPYFRLSKVVDPNDVNKFLFNEFKPKQNVLNLFNDITKLVSLFCSLFNQENAWLRLEALDHQMCPRFHVDNVKCRLVTTYLGPATQWLPNDLVDRSKLGIGSLGKSDEKSGLFSNRADIKQINTGDVALLKGEAWRGNKGMGLVHRSPYKTNNYKRLYMTIDFSEKFTNIDF